MPFSLPDPDRRPPADFLAGRADPADEPLDDALLDELLDEPLDDGSLDDGSLDEEFPLGDGTADCWATVVCPYCGEPADLAVDPGGGSLQQYVEDCPVCCRPWQVTVRFDGTGAATAWCDADDAVLDD